MFKYLHLIHLIGLWLLIGLWTSAPAAHAADPLFADDTIIKIRIEAPFSKLIRKSKRSTDPYPASLTINGAYTETHAITLAPRGKSRRTLDLCKFPPLRVKFPEKPAPTSFFKGQKSLKLVTHCQKSSKYQQHNLLEYSIYKMYNVLTPQSLKVRLAEIDYVDSKNGKTYITRYGFFIEDMDDAAKRNGMKELDTPNITRSQLDIRPAARASLFNYMVGNLDFSMTKGPPNSDCCHNGKLMGSSKTTTQNLIYVPYDFDQTGLVDAPYAVPPANLKVKSARTRVYRGYCTHNAAATSQARSFFQKKEQIKHTLYDITLLTDKHRNSTVKYLDDFFETIGDPQKMNQKILQKCRK